MVRKAEFDDDTFIQAALDVISLGGPGAATMAAIASCANAPTGSIYHRFKSRTALLGATWVYALSSLADEICPVLLQGQPDEAITVLTTWVENNPSKARLVMLYTENDLIDGDLPPELYKNLNDIHKKLGASLSALLKHQKKTLTASNLALANFAIFDGPIAAMKPFLRDKRTSPALTLEKSRQAAMACARASLNLLE